MKPIYKNLYQFTVYIPPMDFTIHQYLLASDPAILFAAGTAQQAVGQAEKQAKEAELAREKKLQETMLGIKNKYGKNAILKGMNLVDGATTKDRNQQIGGHHA